MTFSAGASGRQSEINVTPLIDVLLVLLIIFMVIAPSAQRGLDTELTRGSVKSEAEQMPSPVLIEIAGTEETPLYRVNRHPIAAQALPETLRTAFAVRQQRVVFVRVARVLTVQQVANVVAMAKEAGATEVSLDGAA